LDELDIITKANELGRSRQRLEQKLSQPIRSFSYPYARWETGDFKLLAESGYRTAVSGNDGYFDSFSLSRLDLTQLPIRALPFEISEVFRRFHRQPFYQKFRQLLIQPRRKSA
jgi:hypothetical protein